MAFERSIIVRKIDDLLDGHCKTCTIRTDYNREYGGNTSFITQHCSKECPVGLQLAELGQELKGLVRPRKQITLEVEHDMTGQRTSKEGPSSELTKQVFLEQIAAGETIGSIEKAWGMKYNTLSAWVKKWELKGINATKAQELLAGGTPKETQLLREKEAVPQQPISHDLVKEYKAQVEQLTSAFAESVQENERLKTELAEVKEMFDKAYQRNVNGNAKIGEHLQAIQELREEVEYWRGQADNTGALVGKANETLTDAETVRDRMYTALTETVGENESLQAELNRMNTERDELVAERDELRREKTGWIENERVLNHLVEDLRDDIRRLREIQTLTAEPVSEVQLLDRSIADLTRAKWILNRLLASGE